jgi:Ca2+-binding RTX toxin-like protein
MTITAAEQFLLELINRARLNPVAEAARYNIDLNAGLAPGQLGPQSRQVLAPNTDLNDAAAGHSAWMRGADVFSHTGANGSSPGQRATAEGYTYSTLGENIAFSGTTAATINLSAAIAGHHQGLFLSAGHRANMLNGTFREAGIGQEGGEYTQAGTTYRASMVTELFGLSGQKVFVTGVAYTDSNADAFYSIGEGRAGVSLSAGGVQVATAAAGGYAIGVTAGDSALVRGQVGATAFRATVETNLGNVKLDVVGETWFHSSGSITLGTGIQNVQLLGQWGLSAKGNDAANTLIGNAGGNTLTGGGGSDVLRGMDGNDRLNGGVGADKLFGGNGADRLSGDGANDQLTGGAGADRFVFLASGGHDQVMDFQLQQNDRLQFDDAIWGEAAITTAQLVATYATDTGADVLIDFGNGQSIRLIGLADLTGLSAAIEII